MRGPRQAKPVGLASLVVAAVSLAGCGIHGKPTVDRTKALAYSHEHAAATPSSSELVEPTRVVAPGMVESLGGNVELSPRESGWIARILVNEGQHVDAGQVVAALDDDTQRASEKLAVADLAEREATLSKTLHGSTAEELRQGRADAEAAQARAAIAQRDAERASLLGKASAVPRAEVERSVAEAQAQTALAHAAEAKVAALERGPRAEDRTATQDRVEAARARLELARANVDHRRVVAPVDGTILLSRFHPGEFFTVGGSPLMVLGDTTKLQVRAEVDEIDSFRVKAGASCTLFGDDNHKIVDGNVFRVAPEMGRRGLTIESPTARDDVRVREVFIATASVVNLVPGQRVWAHIAPQEPLTENHPTKENAHVD